MPTENVGITTRTLRFLCLGEQIAERFLLHPCTMPDEGSTRKSQILFGVPDGIRTRVTAAKVKCKGCGEATTQVGETSTEFSDQVTDYDLSVPGQIPGGTQIAPGKARGHIGSDFA